MRLERRLENVARQLALTSPALAALCSRERDSDKNFTEPGCPVKPVLVAVAKDVGRVSLTPIRNLQLTLTIRANAKTASGESVAFDALLEKLEQLLDGTNLVTALTDDVTLEIHTFFAVRQGGCNFSRTGFIREEGYVLSVKAVGTEHTVAS